MCQGHEHTHGGHNHSCGGGHGGSAVNVQGENLVQPAILLFLCEEKLNGAELLSRLNGFGLNLHVDPHTVEHYLIYLEQEGLLTASQAGDRSEKRYQITPEGRANFRSWVPVLQKRRDQLSFILIRADDLG